MNECNFTVSGRRMAALVSAGEGHKLLALHGWLDNAASFIPLAGALPGLDLVALDLAGNGRSDHRGADGEYNIWNDLPDIETVLDQLGWEQCVLLGHSRGAVVACLFASALPQRVSHIVLLDGLPRQSLEAAHCANQLARYVQDRRLLPARPGRVFEDIDAAVQQRKRKGLSTAAARLLAERNLQACEDGWRWSYDPRVKGASAFKLTEAHNFAVLAGLSMPGLLLLAELGLDHLEGSLPTLPESFAVATVAGGHHCHMEDAVADVAAHILEFLGAR